MRIAMIGTRGAPAAYGGFETAVEEIGARLVERGHEVLVYCHGAARPRRRTWRGMRLVHVPRLPLKAAETLSSSAAASVHLAVSRADMAFVFNAANAPFVSFLRGVGIPVAVHVDGLEWKRDKWNGAGRRYYRWAEREAVRAADALIADAQGIADYYLAEHFAPTELLTYGAPIIERATSGRIADLGLVPGGYHLVVARFEPENHVDVIVAGYAASGARRPLVVVGSAPHAAQHTAAITAIAADDDRVRLLGGVWDQQLLDELYANALTYLHGHSVGGTNPSLLRAMGAGTQVIAWDVSFNRGVAGDVADYFIDARSVAAAIETAEADPPSTRRAGDLLREHARTTYDWDDVAAGYERLALRLAPIGAHPASTPARTTETSRS